MAVRPSIKEAQADSLAAVFTPSAPKPPEERPQPRSPLQGTLLPPVTDRRDGRKSMGFWTSTEARRQLHMIALNTDVTAERLLNEALNLLFRARNLPPIAPTD